MAGRNFTLEISSSFVIRHSFVIGYFVIRHLCTLNPDPGLLGASLGPKFELLARNRFDTSDEFSATPAVSDGQLFIRANRTLFCVAKTE